MIKTFLPVTNEYKINTQKVKEWIGQPHLFPFASDPSGDYICFDYQSRLLEPRIILWSHETREIVQVSNTFIDFLDTLYLNNKG